MLVAVGSHSWEEGVLGDRCAVSASSVQSSGKLKSLLIRPGRFLCVSAWSQPWPRCWSGLLWNPLLQVMLSCPLRQVLTDGKGSSRPWELLRESHGFACVSELCSQRNGPWEPGGIHEFVQELVQERAQVAASSFPRGTLGSLDTAEAGGRQKVERKAEPSHEAGRRWTAAAHIRRGQTSLLTPSLKAHLAITEWCWESQPPENGALCTNRLKAVCQHTAVPYPMAQTCGCNCAPATKPLRPHKGISYSSTRNCTEHSALRELTLSLNLALSSVIMSQIMLFLQHLHPQSCNFFNFQLFNCRRWWTELIVGVINSSIKETVGSHTAHQQHTPACTCLKTCI